MKKQFVVATLVSLISLATFATNHASRKNMTECDSINRLLIYLENDSSKSILNLNTKVKELFSNSVTENRNDMLILIEFQPAIPCLEMIDKKWIESADSYPPPHPPMLENRTRHLSLDPKDNPFIWSRLEIKKFGWLVVIGNDSKRIKTIRIEKLDNISHN